MKLTDKGTLNSSRRRALEVNFNGGMITNDGFMGVPVEKGKQYRFYMFAKTANAAEVTAKLCSADGASYGEHTFSVNGGYTKYECVITSTETDFNARLALQSDSAETIVIGFTSLFPVDTYMGKENGLGYHEYLQFCEDAGIDAMYVFNCGMTCQGRNPDYFDQELIEEFYQDAVVPYTEIIAASADYIVTIKPRSVNVIRHNIN